MTSTLRLSAALLALFAIVTAIASLAGAKNLGTAMTFGQVAFAIALVVIMLRGTRQAVERQRAAVQREAATSQSAAAAARRKSR